jgi:hypothetical protein
MTEAPSPPNSTRLVLTITITTLVIASAIFGASYLASRGAPHASSTPELDVKTNATALGAGGTLGIRISLNNTGSAELNVTAASDWQVQGFPAAIFPVCLGIEPVEFMIVKGNYSLSELQTASANTSISYGCMEGGYVHQMLFEPKSSVANLTGSFCEADCSPTTSTESLVTNFTVSGYWTYPVMYDAYPVGEPSPQHLFVPGTYTLVVTDEWGQSVVLYFAVN